MGVLTDIQAAFDTRLNTLLGSPVIAWPNIQYTPVVGTSYIRPTLLPAKTALEQLDGTDLHKGMYQIDIFVPVNQGVDKLYLLMDSIKDLYKNNNLVINTTTVLLQAISRGLAQRVEAWYSAYIQIDYICYSK